MVVFDVVIQILSKLPPESLLRFKSVCKSWYALINDPKFVTKHLLDSFPHKHVLLKRSVINNSGKKEYVFSILNFSIDRSVSSILDVHLPFHENRPAFVISGHSHGLICLQDPHDIYLFNPMTRRFRKLPPSILMVEEPQNDDFSITPTDPIHYGVDCVGFGYDVKCGDFKVVRVVTPWEGVASYTPKVEIFDLRKSRWREITTPVCGCAFTTPSFEMYHEGTFYWWALSYTFPEEEIILTFDMSKEVFGKISLPESSDFERESSYKSLMVLNGSLVFSFYPFETHEKVFKIWKMEKDGSGVVSWSKLLTIGPLFGIKFPLLFVSSDELLMEAKDGQLVLYNCKTQQIKELQVKGEEMQTNSHRFEATFFVKSLISVEGGNNMSYEL